MANIKACGQIVFTDLTDVGTIQAYITSNQALQILYDPNQNIYTPDWSTNNLVLTPVITFNGNNIPLGSTGLEITWTRRAGSLAESGLQTGETVSNGVLTVSSNQLSSISSKLLTYLCTISYTDPDTNVPLTTQALITFSLISQGINLKDINIIGENVFLYNTEQVLVSPDTITLTAETTNVLISQWQYKNSSGDFVAFPTTNNSSISSQTLIVKATESTIFNNDIAVIKVTTNDNTVYDIIVITKIKDGAPGGNSVIASLSNDNHSLPCDNDGNVLSYEGADTKITITQGGEDETSEWNIVATPSSSSISGTWNPSTFTYTVTEMTSAAANVQFTCTRTGYATITKRFSLQKQTSGADGKDAVIYMLDSDVAIIGRDSSGNYQPSSVTFSSYSKSGAEIAKTNFDGLYKIYESSDGSTWGTAKYTSTSVEHTHTYTPSSKTGIRSIKCELYTGSTLVDYQVVSIVPDGKDGDPGAAGEGATNVVLGNYSAIINCTSGGLVYQDTEITINFVGYKGIAKTDCTCNLVSGNLPLGVSIASNTPCNSSSSYNGSLKLKFAKGSSLGNASTMSGTINIPFSVNSTSVSMSFVWSKHNAALDGENAVLFQIVTPYGDVIHNGKNNVTLKAQLTDGTSIVNSGITYTWKKFSDGSYTAIQGETSGSLVVTPDMVDSFASFRCEATYNNTEYIAYWTVRDTSDPVELSILSSIGTQIVNGNGIGAVFVRIYRNGEEIDPIKTTVFSQTAPSSASSGDYYYHLNSSNKTVVLKKYNGSSWVDETDYQPTCTYKYYRRDKDGNILDKNAPYAEGKVMYIDSSIINKKVIFDVEVDIPS